MKILDISRKKIAIMLSIAMLVSIAPLVFDEAFAMDQGPEASMNGELSENKEAEGPTLEGQKTEDTVHDQTSSKEEEKMEVVPPVDISSDIDVVKKPEGFVDIRWSSDEGAAYYLISLTNYNGGAPERVETNTSSNQVQRTFKDLESDTEYTFTVEAYDENDSLIAAGIRFFKTYRAVFAESQFRGLAGSNKTSAIDQGINLRAVIGEGYYGYAVAQGACTDGIYAYYMMSSSSNQKGRVVKVRLSDKTAVGVSPVALDTHHANGMTYDSKRDQLLAVGYGKWRHELTYIDPHSLTVTEKKSLQYNNIDMEGIVNGYSANGVAAIAYVEAYDVFVTRVRGDVNSGALNDIMVFDAGSLELIGYIKTKVTSSYPGTYQSIDADERYVYLLQSAGDKQPYNLILAMDWNAENIIPVVNGDAEYVKKIWSCNNDGSGKPDAVYRIPTSHEIEGLFHVKDSYGRSRFYASEYHGRWKYKTVTKKKKVVVRKKVKKKVKVKWKKVKKKVKVKGKWKTKKVWKYKWKTKKVWKKKIKYKIVKAKVKDCWARDDYVYDLGVI